MIDLKELLAKKLLLIIDGFSLDEIKNAISEPPKPEMADFALPCFVLSKKLKKAPQLISKELAEKFSLDDLFISAKAEGPFLNIFVDPTNFAFEIIDPILREREYFGSLPNNEKVVVADFSSPNIAKHLGVHHLRSTMIGNAICNLHQKIGYKVWRVNYLGDWGTQFGKLIAAYKKWHADEELTVQYLADLYVRFNKASKDSPALEEEGRLWFKKLEDWNSEAVELWKKFKAIILNEFNLLYQRLGLEFSIFDGESNYSQAAQDVVKQCLHLGIAVHSQGAIVIPMSENKPPCILQKSDGATTYLARDVGAVIQRYGVSNFEKMLYIVGHGQSFHFEQVFYVLEKMGYTWYEKCHHIPFGLLKFEGAKFSSRQGNMLLLKDVLDTAAEEVAGIANEKGNTITESTVDSIGIGAVVFADLSRKRTNDANFKWEEILNFDGSTGPYLQYTTARCTSILDKSAQDTSNDMRLYDEDSFNNSLSLLAEDGEKRLLLKLSQFEEILITAAENCDPAVLCQYALKLAKQTNKYLHNVRVIQDNKTLQIARTALLDCVLIVLCESLRIIGIKPLEKM